MNYTFIKNYRDDKSLRHSLNNLTRITYHFDFESWYQAGGWTDLCMPYSLEDKGVVVAHVMVNQMHMRYQDKDLRYIQLGTVMTHPDYRKQGLSRWLIEKIMEEWKGKTDGIYLYANDYVLDFYPRFGFEPSKEFIYTGYVGQRSQKEMCHLLNMKRQEDYDLFWQALGSAVSQYQLSCIDHELEVFYALNMFRNHIWLIPDMDVIAIANREEKELYHMIAPHLVDIHEVASVLFEEGAYTLGFTPQCKEGFSIGELDEENNTFFILGEPLKIIENNQLRFPELSHT